MIKNLATYSPIWRDGKMLSKLQQNRKALRHLSRHSVAIGSDDQHGHEHGHDVHAMHGYKYRRQYGVDQYILDFYCPELKLAIEIDGDLHFVP